MNFTFLFHKEWGRKASVLVYLKDGQKGKNVPTHSVEDYIKKEFWDSGKLV